MKETIELGSAPHGENCAQLGRDGYEELARLECHTFINQLLREYDAAHGKKIPHGFTLKVKSNSHDFGVYFEVAMTFNDDNQDAVNAAMWFENNVPERWDETSKLQLNK